jgi:hypothetical protein
MTEVIDRLLEWLPYQAGMTNEVDGLLIGIPDQIGYNGENSGMTEKGFPSAVGNDGRSTTLKSVVLMAGMIRHKNTKRG